MESENITMGNGKDRNAIKLELNNIADFGVQIRNVHFNNFKNVIKEVILTTSYILSKSDFEKLKKYFEKYDYEFSSLYPFKNSVILFYQQIKGE